MLIFLLASESDLAAIMHKGAYGFGSLPDEENLCFSTWFFTDYNPFDFAYHQFKNGQIEEAMWRKMAYEMPFYVNGLPGVKEWCSRDQARFSEEFVAYLEDRMSKMEPPSELSTIGMAGQKATT
jgi:hypothetical protein